LRRRARAGVGAGARRGGASVVKAASLNRSLFLCDRRTIARSFNAVLSIFRDVSQPALGKVPAARVPSRAPRKEARKEVEEILRIGGAGIVVVRCPGEKIGKEVEEILHVQGAVKIPVGGTRRARYQTRDVPRGQSPCTAEIA